MSSIKTYIDEHQAEFIEDLRRLVAQPSVSSTGEGVEACLELVRETCQKYGFDELETIHTQGHPALLARALSDKSNPTVVIYGHYDVQPVDPSEWDSEPFDPTIRPGPDDIPRLYGRGAGDNKGQFFAHLCAVRTLKATEHLPVNVTLLLDGEGEDGSPHLRSVVQDYADQLNGEVLYWADGNAHESGRPQIWLGSRGMVYADLSVQTDHSALHSGHNSPEPNPAWGLVGLLASMKQPDGTVSIEGFSDAVQPPTEADLELLEGMPFKTLGGGDRSYFEELFFEPSLNISGIVSGHTGVGKRAIIPGEAGAKLDIRLVPGQDPDAVFDQMQAHIRSYEKTHMPEELEVSFEMQSRVEPNRTAPDEPVVEPVIRAVRKAWNCDPIVQPIAGGSGPDYVFEEIGLPVILVTYGNADENQHGPNENIALPSFRQGIRATIGMFENVASLRT